MKFAEDTVGVRAVLVCDSWLNFLERIPDMSGVTRMGAVGRLCWTIHKAEVQKNGSESGRMKDFFDSSKSIDFRRQRSKQMKDRERVFNLFRIHG